MCHLWNNVAGKWIILSVDENRPPVKEDGFLPSTKTLFIHFISG